jgi:MFS family permease
MLAVGALLGGLATAFLGVQAAFILDALTFVVSAWFLTRIGVRSRGEPASAEEQPVARKAFLEIFEGMRYLWGQPLLLAFALIKSGGSLVWGGINVLEIPLAEEIFPLNGNGTLTLGLIYAAVGVGTGFGPIFVRSLLGDARIAMLKAVLIGFLAMTIGTFGLALAPSLGWVLGATAIRGVGTGVIWVFSAVLLQLLIPDRLRGRVFAFEFAAFTLAQSVSTLWAGYAYDNLGWTLTQVLFSAGLSSVLMTVLWLFFYTRVHGRPRFAT